MGVLWDRAHLTLGEVTLAAIVDRVVRSAVDRYPDLAALYVDSDGVQCSALRRRIDSVEPASIEGGLPFIVEEFLTVLGDMTADILTPALQAELIVLDARAAPLSAERQRRVGPRFPWKKGGGAQT